MAHYRLLRVRRPSRPRLGLRCQAALLRGRDALLWRRRRRPETSASRRVSRDTGGVSRRFRVPRVRHVTTCIYCGWRESVKPGNAVAIACPNDGGSLEHFVTAIDDPDELRDIWRDGQDSRRPTHSYSVRRREAA